MVEVSTYLPQPIMHPVYVPSPASQPAPGATACLAIESTFLYIFFLYCGAVQFSKLGFVKRRPAARSRQCSLSSGRCAGRIRGKKGERNHKRSASANAISRLPAPPCCAGAKCQFFFMPMPAKAFLLFHTVHTSYKYIYYIHLLYLRILRWQLYDARE